jgi:YVTN family beta-propeller protein
VSPDGRSVYVGNTGSNSISQYDVGAGGALTPKSPATVAAGTNPFGVAVSPEVRVPTSKDQCKNGGYAQFGFASQGQCLAFLRGR